MIPAERGNIFKGFMDKVTNERRKGDDDLKYAIIAEMWKLVGNSAFGRTGMNKSKHRNVHFCDEHQFNTKKYDYFYYDADEYNGTYVVTMTKKNIKQNIPIQVACSIYDDSKLRMLQFKYDCVDKYIDRSDYQYIQMDTDSAYMALTDDFEKLIKPELKEEFLRERNKWFPLHNDKADQRTPGLFKTEFEGDAIIVECSKMYCARGYKKDKYSCKGMQHKNNKLNTNFLVYRDVLFWGTQNSCKNTGFRIINNEMVTYETCKNGLTSVYDKGYVMDDGFHIRPLDI